MAIGIQFIGRMSAKFADILNSMSSERTSLVCHCVPFAKVFDAAGAPLDLVETDRQLVVAIDAVLSRGGLGSARHLLIMVRSAASPTTALSDRLALRAILDGDEERAASIWRAELEGCSVVPSGLTEYSGIRST